MRIDPIQLLQQNELILDYRESNNKIMKYFDYTPFHSYKNRISDLKERFFKREALAEVLGSLNERWNAPFETFKNIERLKDDNSVVVIGGQQAGLLTGPLYSINKIISIIQLAKAKEKELSIPVIPVFWIAGEDHDYEEINHIFLQKDNEVKKYKYWQSVEEKKSISHMNIDHETVEEWLKQIFSDLDETIHTKYLYEGIKSCLDQSDTFVDFFAQFIHHLFKGEGLVLIDSGDKKVRELESEYFIELIKKQPEITVGVKSQLKNLMNEGYSVALDVDEMDSHLFYYTDYGERVLLIRNDEGEWIGKQNEVSLTTDQIMEIAKTNPAKLSNNVVTRPVMQELLFPTLAFIAGNGEIAYWSSLKPVFSALGIKMPPILPRLSFTYIPSNIEKHMKKYGLSMNQVINDGIEEFKINWLAAKHNPPIDQMVKEIKCTIQKIHQPLQQAAANIRADMESLAEKNLILLHKEIDFLHQRLNQALYEKYEIEINHFNLIGSAIHPLNKLQERTWNPIQLINEHGMSFIEELINQELSFEETHYAIYL